MRKLLALLMLCFVTAGCFAGCSKVDSSAVMSALDDSQKTFAESVQKAVADKSLDTLADLCTYPLYVGIDDGVTVNSKEEFTALGAEKVLTDALVDAVKGADLSRLSVVKAGIVIGSESGKPNVTIGINDGKLGITGINY